MILTDPSLRFPEELSSLYRLLKSAANVSDTVREDVLQHALECKGLSLEEAAILLLAPTPWSKHIFNAAASVNMHVKKRLITFYGVVYIHDYCVNICTYCGDSFHAERAKRKILNEQEFASDIQALLKQHPLQEICFLMGEDWARFNHDQLIQYLQIAASIYHNKIILNIPPLTLQQFQKIRESLPNNRLHFRVFQETYDSDIYAREHKRGPKVHFSWRANAQARALEAGFDEVGHGVLYGLNDKLYGHQFETLAMIVHARTLYNHFGKKSQSMSFPRVLPAPDIEFHPPCEISDDVLMRCVSVVKLAEPNIDTVITCRESAIYRRKIRPIVNIEDYGARPGPGGNSIPETRQQMILPDTRQGEEVRREIINDGYQVR